MEQLEDEYAIGLDLGTTFSCIGVYRNGWVEIIPNKNGDSITPSVVIIDGDKLLVGEDTTNYLVQNYDSCIHEVKRLIGREINQKEMDELKKRLSFDIVKPKSNKNKNYPEISIKSKGKTKTYSPVEISSYIIKKMVLNAEKYLKKRITKLVITVPANFNDSQRALTRQAAEALNLKVLRIINEPTAAALAYGFDEKKDQNCNILIFDLGGGTFDVSILSLQKDQKTNSTNFDVLGTAGDTNLGGEDFDNILVELVLEKLGDSKKADQIRNDKKAMKKLKVSCENIKKILSISDKANLHINEIIKGVDIIEIIDRKDFEDKCKPLFNRLIEPISKAMQIAKEKQNDIKIDEVILVGGSTRIPKVKEIVRNKFQNCKINDSINPDEAVAYGATIAAEKILHNRDDTIKNFSLLDITPISLGTDIQNNDPNSKSEGSIMDIIIKRGTHIPVSKLKRYKTIHDNETSMSIDIYEGEKKYVKYNHLLKQSNIEGLTPRPKGKTKVIIKFDIDVNGILNVEAKEESPDNNGQIINLSIKNDEVSLSNEEMEELKKKIESFINKLGVSGGQNMNSINSNITQSEGVIAGADVSRQQEAKDSIDLNYINIKKVLKIYKEAFNKCNEEMKNKKKADEGSGEEEDDRINYIKNYYTTLETFINKLDKNFDNETVLYKYYLYIKDLFENYLEALKLDLPKADKEDIFKKINEYIQIFVNQSSGYLNELLEVLSKMKKKGNKINFYKIIIFVIIKLNELGRKTIVSEKPFCKHHSLMYFEQSKSILEKYFPKKSEMKSNDKYDKYNKKSIEEERENVALLPHGDIETLKAESKLCFEYIQDIKSGAILFCEEFLQKGVLINEEAIKSSGTGLTGPRNQLIISKINKDNLEKLLSNYEKLLSNIQITDDFTKKEALCIASILKIYRIMGEKVDSKEIDFTNKSKYLLYLAKRCELIVEHLQIDKNENWYKEFNKIYNELKDFDSKSIAEKEYPEILKDVNKKHPEVFKNIEDNFKNKKSNKDFFKFIVEKHPFYDKEKEGYRNYEVESPELLTFLLNRYSPCNYPYMESNDQKKLNYCIAHEIFKKLNSMNIPKQIN